MGDAALSVNTGSGILNGKVVTPADAPSRAVVKILFDQTAEKVSSCSGTLVDQRFVVTAAHCLVNDSGTEHRDIVVVFENSDPQVKIPADSFIAHPLYQRLNKNSYDVGLILLASDAPANYVPAILQLNFVDPRSVSLFDSGYGTTESPTQTEGLRWTSVKLASEEELVPLQKDYINYIGANEKDSSEIILSQPLPSSHGICSGDSGDIPAWERAAPKISDSKNIEIFGIPQKLPSSLHFLDRSFSVYRARLVSSKSPNLKIYQGDITELQISTDEAFNCETDPRTSKSGPILVLPLIAWPQKTRIENQGSFIAFLAGEFKVAPVHFHTFAISKTKIRVNVMDADKHLTSLDIDLSDCPG